MYEAYWGLRQGPFENVPDPQFFCTLPAHQDVLEKLRYAVESGKAGALLTGNIGSGKTTLCRVLLAQLKDDRFDIGLVVNPPPTLHEFLREVASQLGIPLPTGIQSELFRALSDHLWENAQRDRTTLLIVDEADAIADDAVFEHLRMLLNIQLNDRQLMTLILLGPPQFRERLARHASLDQRLAMHLSLPNLNEDETALYIESRMERAGAARSIFTPDAVSWVWRATAGVPRRINSLCDLCLLEGWRRQAAMIDGALVHAAAAML